MIEFNKYNGEDDFNVEIASILAGNIYQSSVGWKYDHNPDYKYVLDSDDLRTIADKLDELNAEAGE